jgi:glycosyltransferase involved in cell wall biosynthesis
MRVAILLGSGRLSGAEKRALKLATALNTRGHSVVLLMDEVQAQRLKNSSPNRKFPPLLTFTTPWWLAWLGLGHGRAAWIRHGLGLNRLELALGRWWWRQQKSFQDLSLVHVFLRPHFLRYINASAVFEVTSPDIAEYIRTRRALIPKETVLHSVSDSVAARIMDAFPENRIITAKLPFFYPRSGDPIEFRNKEDIIIFAHRLIKRKNPMLFARAARRFLDVHPNWKILIRGQGPLENEIRELLSKEIATGAVHIGFNPSLEEDLARAKIFVSLVEQDNYPSQSVLEAMWAGNALLLSDRGQTRQKFLSSNGVICNLNDDELLSSLLFLTSDPARLLDFGRNSRRHVETAFAPGEYMDDLVDTYTKSMEGRA